MLNAWSYIDCSRKSFWFGYNVGISVIVDLLTESAISG